MSIRPNSSTTRRTIASTWLLSRRSMPNARARRPAARTLLAPASASACSQSTHATSQPSRAKPGTMAWPNSPLAPVIMAIFPSSCIMYSPRSVGVAVGARAVGGVLGAGPLGAELILRDRRRRVAAIHVEGLAHDEIRVVAREEDRRADEVVGVTHAAQRKAAAALGRLGLAVRRLLDAAVGEGVDVDAVIAEGLPERPRHGIDPGAGRAPGDCLAGPQAPNDRGQVDDLARALLGHLLAHRLAGQEEGLEAHRDGVVEIGLVEGQERLVVGRAGHVGEDVDAAEFGDGALHHGNHLRLVRDVHLQPDRPPPGIARSFGDRLGLRPILVDRDEIGALPREAQGHGLAVAAPRTRHDRDLVLQPHARPPLAPNHSAKRVLTSVLSTNISGISRARSVTPRSAA